MSQQAKLEALIAIRSELRGLKKSVDGMKRFNKEQKKVTKDAGTFDRAMLKKVAGIGLLTLGVKKIAGELRGMAIELDKVAGKLPFTTDELQKLQYGARQFHIETGVVNLGMQRFARRLAEAAEGKGELLPIIEKYNIQIRDSAGRTREAWDILGDYAELVKNTTDKKERLRIAFKAFDSEGVDLVNVLKDGRNGLRAYGHEADALGMILKENTIKQISELELRVNNLWTRLKVTIGNTGGDIWETFDPVTLEGTIQKVLRMEGLLKVAQESTNPAVAARASAYERQLEQARTKLATFLGEVDQGLLDQQDRVKEIQDLIARAQADGADETFVKVLEDDLFAAYVKAVDLEDQLVKLYGMAGKSRMIDFGFTDPEADREKTRQAGVEGITGAAEGSRVTEAVANTGFESVFTATSDGAAVAYSAVESLEEKLIDGLMPAINSADDALFNMMVGIQTPADAALSLLEMMGRALFEIAFQELFLSNIKRAIRRQETQQIMTEEAQKAPLLMSNAAATSVGSYGTSAIAGMLLALLAITAITAALTAREHGGPVTAGQPYLVGEKRPELFVPHQSGYIVPRVPQSAPANGNGNGNGGDRLVYDEKQTFLDALESRMGQNAIVETVRRNKGRIL